MEIRKRNPINRGDHATHKLNSAATLVSTVSPRRLMSGVALIFALILVGISSTFSSPVVSAANSSAPPPVEPGQRMIILVSGITTHLQTGGSDLIDTKGERHSDIVDFDGTWSELGPWLVSDRGVPLNNIIYFSYHPEVALFNSAAEYWDDGLGLRARPFTCTDTLQSIDTSSANLAKIFDLFPHSTFDIIAHSLGGVVSTNFAASSEWSEYRGRIHSVTTLDSPVRGLSSIKESFATHSYRTKCEEKDHVNLTGPVAAAQDLDEDDSSVIVNTRDLSGNRVDVISISNPYDAVVPLDISRVNSAWKTPDVDACPPGFSVVLMCKDHTRQLLNGLFNDVASQVHSAVLRVDTNPTAASKTTNAISDALKNDGPRWSRTGCRVTSVPNAAVSPGGGTTNDSFELSIDYSNGCGRPPSWVAVNLFGPNNRIETVRLAPTSGNNYVSGVRYTGSISNLSEGLWEYQAWAHDGVDATNKTIGYIEVQAPAETTPPEKNPGLPGERVLSLTATGPVPLDGSSASTITATLTESGTPVKGARIHFSADRIAIGGGWLDSSGNADLISNYGFTDSNGRTSVRFRPSWLGMTRIEASASFGLTKATSFQVIQDPNKVPDFGLAVNPSTITISRGQTKSSSVTLTGQNGFWELVPLSVEGLPTGVTGFFESGQIIQPGETKTLNIIANNNVNHGSYTFEVVGTGDAIVHRKRVNLVVSAGSIKLLSPLGGEEFLINGSIPVSWEYDGLVKVEASVDGGVTWQSGGFGYECCLGDAIGDFRYPSRSARIRIMANNDSSVIAESDDFLVCDPNNARLRASSPAPGLTLSPNARFSIEWSAVGCNPVAGVDLGYSDDGGATWNSIVDNYPNTGSYPWTVPSILNDNYRLKIEATGMGGDVFDVAVVVPFKVGVTGNPWTQTTSNNAEILALVVAPSNANVAYASVHSNGIFKSIDGGNTWNNIFADSGNDTFSSIAVHPTNPNILWVGSKGGTAALPGVYRSSNGGSTWNHSDSGLRSENCPTERVEDMMAVAVAPSNTNRIFAAGEVGIYRSDDSGISWINVDAPGGCNDGNEIDDALSIAVHPTNQNLVYIGTDDPHAFKSTDAGRTWTDMNVRSAQDSLESEMSWITLDPSNSEIIYVGGDDALYKSSDSGSSWIRIAKNISALEPAEQGFLDVVVDPSNSDVFLALDTTHAPGVFRSRDGGLSWSEFSPCDSATSKLAVGATGAHLLYAGTDNWCGSDIWVKDLDERPAVFITSPSGGGLWEARSKQSIEWLTTGPTVDSIAVSVSFDDGLSFIQIASVGPTADSANWTVPAADTEEARIRVELIEGSSVTASAISRRFVIVPDTIAPVITELRLDLHDARCGRMDAGILKIRQGCEFDMTATAFDSGGDVTVITPVAAAKGLFSPGGVTTNQALANTPGTDFWSTTVRATNWTEGFHRIGVEASDLSGNVSIEPFMRRMLVANPPVISDPIVTPELPRDSAPWTVCVAVADESVLRSVIMTLGGMESLVAIRIPMKEVSGRHCGTATNTRIGQYIVGIEATDEFGEMASIDVPVNVTDGTPPIIWNTTPTGLEVPTDSSIKITFSEKMDVNTAESPVSVSGNVPFSTNWGLSFFGTHILTVTPDSGFDPDTRIDVIVASSVSDISGLTLDGNGDGKGSGGVEDEVKWSFTTKPSGLTCAVEAYDSDGSGFIERLEAVEAVTDFLLQRDNKQGTVMTRDEAVRVVTAYLLGRPAQCPS